MIKTTTPHTISILQDAGVPVLDTEGNVLAIAQDAYTQRGDNHVPDAANTAKKEKEIPVIDISAMVIDLSCSHRCVIQDG